MLSVSSSVTHVRNFQMYRLVTTMNVILGLGSPLFWSLPRQSADDSIVVKQPRKRMKPQNLTFFNLLNLLIGHFLIFPLGDPISEDDNMIKTRSMRRGTMEISIVDRRTLE